MPEQQEFFNPIIFRGIPARIKRELSSGMPDLASIDNPYVRDTLLLKRAVSLFFEEVGQALTKRTNGGLQCDYNLQEEKIDDKVRFAALLTVRLAGTDNARKFWVLGDSDYINPGIHNKHETIYFFTSTRYTGEKDVSSIFMNLGWAKWWGAKASEDIGIGANCFYYLCRGIRDNVMGGWKLLPAIDSLIDGICDGLDEKPEMRAALRNAQPKGRKENAPWV